MVRDMMADTVMTESEVENIHRLLSDLGRRMEKGFDELKELFEGVEERVRKVEHNEASCNPQMTLRMMNVEKSVKDNHDEIKILKNIATKLQHTNEILTWLFVLLTTLATGVLIAWLSRIVGA